MLLPGAQDNAVLTEESGFLLMTKILTLVSLLGFCVSASANCLTYAYQVAAYVEKDGAIKSIQEVVQAHDRSDAIAKFIAMIEADYSGYTWHPPIYVAPDINAPKAAKVRRHRECDAPPLAKQ